MFDAIKIAPFLRGVLLLFGWLFIISILALPLRAQEPPPGCGPFEITGYQVITRGNPDDLVDAVNLMQSVGWKLVGPIAVAMGPLVNPATGLPYEMYTATLFRE